jgi:hypothetical protein
MYCRKLTIESGVWWRAKSSRGIVVTSLLMSRISRAALLVNPPVPLSPTTSR